MRVRGDMELHPFTVAFGDLAFTFAAYSLVARWISVPGFAEAMESALPWLGLVTVFLNHTLHLTVVQGRSAKDSLRAAGVSSLMTGTVAAAIFLLLAGLPFRPETVAGPVVGQLVAILVWRLCCVQIGFWIRGARHVLVVGTESEAQFLSAKLQEAGGKDYTMTARAAGAAEARHLLTQANSVLVTPSLPQADKNDLLAACLVSGRECLVLPDSYEISLCQAEVRQIADLPVLAIRPIGLSRVEQLTKRAFDIVCSVAGLVLLAPVWLVIAVLIRLNSEGPIFYAQERVGRGSRIFRCLKFRTMRQDAEAHTGPVLATDNDPRITSIGRFLRATRLDETPQLLNVLRGEMSVVGPRPERPFFVDQIAQALPDYRYRLMVQPGLTGLAQVEAGYSIRPEDKLRYDLLYIQNFSVLLDIRILLATIRVVLFPGQHRGVTLAVGSSGAPGPGSDS